MIKKKNFENAVKGMTGRIFHFRHGSRWAIVTIAVTLLLGFAVHAKADLVYGRVYEAEGKFPPEGTFTLINNQDKKEYIVKTDGDRGYSIVIPQGIYKVEFKQGDISWEAEIRSVSAPIQQDIYLKRVG
jgi:hypothetical protein